MSKRLGKNTADNGIRLSSIATKQLACPIKSSVDQIFSKILTIFVEIIPLSNISHSIVI